MGYFIHEQKNYGDIFLFSILVHFVWKKKIMVSGELPKSKQLKSIRNASNDFVDKKG